MHAFFQWQKTTKPTFIWYVGLECVTSNDVCSSRCDRATEKGRESERKKDSGDWLCRFGSFYIEFIYFRVAHLLKYETEMNIVQWECWKQCSSVFIKCVWGESKLRTIAPIKTLFSSPIHYDDRKKTRKDDRWMCRAKPNEIMCGCGFHIVEAKMLFLLHWLEYMK